MTLRLPAARHHARLLDLPRRRLWAGLAITTSLLALVAALVHPLIALALCASLIASPFVLARVDVALLALVAVITLLPFGALRLGIGFNPTLLDPALGLLYAIWLFRLVYRRDRLRWPPLSGAVAVFLGLMVTALVVGLVHGAPTKNQLRNFAELLLAAGLYFVIPALVTTPAQRRRLLGMLVGCGTVAALVGLGLYLLPRELQVQLLSALRVLDYPDGPGVLRFLNDDPSRLQRATGTSVDPNSFGGLLAVMAALLLPLAARGRRMALMFAIVCAALLATVSRGSLVGLAAAAMVVGLARDRRLLMWGFVAGGGLFAAAQFLPWTQSYLEHFLAGLTQADRATQMRLGEYNDAVRLIQRYPWFGVGFGSPKDVDLYRGVSSLFLILAATTGLIGLASFVVAAGAAAGKMVLALRRRAKGADNFIDPDPDLVLGALAALAAALVGGLFDHYFFTYPHAFALFWLVAALGVGAAGNDQGAAPTPR